MQDGVPVTCGDGTATLSVADGTLKLENATIIASDSSALYALRADNGDLNIVLVGENRIESSGQKGVYGSSTDLTLSGQGSLTVEAVGDAVQVDNGSVTVDGCDIDVLSEDYWGLYCGSGTMSTVSIRNGADVMVESKEGAITAYGGLSISDSTVMATSNGSGTNVVYSDADISIHNSIVTATGTDSGAYPAIYAFDDITITGRSNVTAASKGMRGIYTDSDMTIDGSTVTAYGTTHEGMVVRGSLTISDSTVTATGCSNPVTPAIQTKSLEVSGASEVTCYGGVNAIQSLVVAPAQDALVDVMVGTLLGGADGAGHFDQYGVTSPLGVRTDFNAFSEGDSTALDWLNRYTYLRIGKHAHVFDQKVVTDQYKVAGATCTDAATYSYSCVCGEKGTETFEYGAPLGHEWGEPAWSWEDDYSSATATFACQRDASHTQAVAATVASKVTTPATCTEGGTTTYTASVSFNKQQYSDAKGVADIPATGHAWGEPSYAWAADGASCEATRACERDSAHVQTARASVSSAPGEGPTCQGPGTTVYTATFAEGWAEAQEKVVADVPALGHIWGEPTWIWADDHAAATATFACQRDGSHTRELAAEVTSETTDPTITETGSTVYTATVELGGLIYTDVQTVIIPAIGTGNDGADGGDGGSSSNEPGQGDGRAEGAMAKDDDEADGEAGGAPLPKTGDGGGTALLLAGALLAAGACSGVLAWRMIRKAA